MTADTAIYRHVTRGRSPGNYTALGAILVGLICARLWLDLAWGWIVLGLVVCVPLLWDILSNRETLLEIRPEVIIWQRPKGTAEIPAKEISHIDLKLRLDRSVKLQVRLHNGTSLTAPPEAMPKAPMLEEALHRAGYNVRRHPFALL